MLHAGSVVCDAGHIKKIIFSPIYCKENMHYGRGQRQNNTHNGADKGIIKNIQSGRIDESISINEL
jgi:hypothetical protein